MASTGSWFPAVGKMCRGRRTTAICWVSPALSENEMAEESRLSLVLFDVWPSPGGSLDDVDRCESGSALATPPPCSTGLTPSSSKRLTYFSSLSPCPFRRAILSF
jgi:hypothetical protein